MTHDDATELLHAMQENLLNERTRAELESHLEGCARCRGMAATYAAIHDVLQEENEHLAADEIVTYVTDRDNLVSIERQRVEAHAAACANCRDEISRVETVHASVQADPEGRRGSGKRSWWSPRSGAWLAVAAATLAAVLVYPAYLGIYRLPSVADHTVVVDEQNERLESELERLRAWSGPVGMELISGGLRAVGKTHTIKVDPNRPFVIIGIQVVITGEVPDDEPIRFEILSTNQEPIVFMELIAREAREQVQTAGVVTWLVPTEKFTPGEYTIEVGAPNGPDLLNVPVEVRQVDPS